MSYSTLSGIIWQGGESWDELPRDPLCVMRSGDERGTRWVGRWGQLHASRWARVTL